MVTEPRIPLSRWTSRFRRNHSWILAWWRKEN